MNAAALALLGYPPQWLSSMSEGKFLNDNLKFGDE